MSCYFFRTNPSRLIKLLCVVSLLLCIAFTIHKSVTPISTVTRVPTESHFQKFVEDGEPTEFQRIPLKTLIQQYPKDTNYFLYNWLSFLGFNNVRYMIEHAYYYGHLLNRTVVLPHRVHCRSCLHEGYCHALGKPVDDSQIMDLADGKDGKHRWSIPIEEFIDMNRMVEKSGGTMIRMQDFLRLQLYYQDLDRKGNTNQRNLIQYWDAIDPIEYLRDQRGITFEDGSASNFTVAFPSLSYVGTDRVHTICGQENSVDDLSPILAKEKKLRQAGQTSIDLYGYPDEPNYSVREFTTKTISLDDIPNLMGFAQEFGTNKYPQQLLHFTGRYIHWFPRRQFHFATEENRNKYDNFVLNIFRHPYRVRKAAEHLYNNLELQLAARGVHPVSKIHNTTEYNHNVSLGNFLGVHARRGDFIRYNWLGDLATVEAWQQAMVKLIDLAKSKKGLQVFYLASDESSLDAYDDLYKHGMIRIFDLMDPEFISEYAQLATFGDWLALLDQQILAQSEFFVATYLSSVSGGILNMRKGLGVNDGPVTREWMHTLLKEID